MSKTEYMEVSMDRFEVTDRIFDILNETNELELADIETTHSGAVIQITMDDGKKFEIEIKEAD